LAGGEQMHKEIKRLTQLSQCTHLSKTDRDACTWAIQQIEPPVVEPDKGFDGYDFSSWPELPDQKLFTELIKSRKAKTGCIMTQAWVNSVARQMKILQDSDITVNQACEEIAKNGWQGLQAWWITDNLQGNVIEEITINNVMSKIQKALITSVSQIPNAVAEELERQVKIGGIKKETALAALQKIGFIF